MVFSLLFGRKDKAAARPSRGAAASSRASGNPDLEVLRERARHTAAQIDRIESEMIAPRGLTRPDAEVPTLTATVPVPVAEPRLATVVHLATPARRSTDPQPAPASGIEVLASTLAPELEEAALLFANGQIDEARRRLRGAVQNPDFAGMGRLPWMMLLDVLQFAGDRQGFDAVALDFAQRFEVSPPSWDDGKPPPPLPLRRSSARASLALPARLDGGCARLIEQCARLAQARRRVLLDATAVRQADAEGAALLTAALATFERDGLEVAVQGAAALLQAARSGIETGRRDLPDSLWRLALLALRLLDQRTDFEDLSIDFCVTYEVSPPPWEPLAACLRLREAGTEESATEPVTGTGAKPAAIPPDGVFVLEGEWVGSIGPRLQELRHFAAHRPEVLVDCRRLQRLEFVAGGDLLNLAAGLAAEGRRLVLLEPSHIVEVLLRILGVQEHVAIRRRSAA